MMKDTDNKLRVDKTTISEKAKDDRTEEQKQTFLEKVKRIAENLKTMTVVIDARVKEE